MKYSTRKQSLQITLKKLAIVLYDVETTGAEIREDDKAETSEITFD